MLNNYMLEYGEAVILLTLKQYKLWVFILFNIHFDHGSC